MTSAMNLVNFECSESGKTGSTYLPIMSYHVTCELLLLFSLICSDMRRFPPWRWDSHSQEPGFKHLGISLEEGLSHNGIMQDACWLVGCNEQKVVFTTFGQFAKVLAELSHPSMGLWVGGAIGGEWVGCVGNGAKECVQQAVVCFLVPCNLLPPTQSLHGKIRRTGHRP